MLEGSQGLLSGVGVEPSLFPISDPFSGGAALVYEIREGGPVSLRGVGRVAGRQGWLVRRV